MGKEVDQELAQLRGQDAGGPFGEHNLLGVASAALVHEAALDDNAPFRRPGRVAVWFHRKTGRKPSYVDGKA
jgi:hypothetical protein